MRTGLTPRQDQVYEYLRSYTHRHRQPPTIAEIGESLGIRSPNAVHKLLKSLEAKGWIRRRPGVTRGLFLLDAEDALPPADAVPRLAQVGHVHSDTPERLRLARSPRAFYVDPYFLGSAAEEDCLLVRLADDGLAPDGLRKNDYVVVQETSLHELQDGDVVAALLGETQVARFLGGVLRRTLHLRATAKGYDPHHFVPNDPACYVIGRIVAVMRRLTSAPLSPAENAAWPPAPPRRTGRAPGS